MDEIREATINDLNSLQDLMERVYNPFFAKTFKNNYNMELNREGFLLASSMFIRNPDCSTIIAVNENNEVVGCIFASLLRWHLNPTEIYANFSHWCIDQGKADRNLGARLFREAENWSKGRGAKFISVALIDNFEPTAKLKVALELVYGFKKEESIYMKGL
jgi:hypothetical protein